MKILFAVIFIAAGLCASAVMAAEAGPPDGTSGPGNWQIYDGGPNYFDLGIGAFAVDADGKSETSPAARIEVRFGPKIFFLGPTIGILATLDGGYFAYGGVHADIRYRRLVLTPGIAAGAYEEGHGKDLGGIFEFRSSAAIAYQFDNRARLGIQVAHLSHLKIYEKNPGEEDLFLTMAFPF